MKNKILILIIGMLIGAIITTTVFLIYNKVLEKNPKESQMLQMNGEGQSKPPSNGNMGGPPERPSESGATSSDISASSSNNHI